MVILRILIVYIGLTIFTLLLYPKLALGLIAFFLLSLTHKNARKKTKEAMKRGIGVCEAILESSAKKETNKNKILELLRNSSELSNADVSKPLSISSRTVVRYMDELEKEGMVKQVGEVGQNVTYKLK